ncbi:MAG: BamA/TamA family outer membrane protein [Planctomycetota bacterium]
MIHPTAKGILVVIVTCVGFASNAFAQPASISTLPPVPQGGYGGGYQLPSAPFAAQPLVLPGAQNGPATTPGLSSPGFVPLGTPAPLLGAPAPGTIPGPAGVNPNALPIAPNPAAVAPQTLPSTAAPAIPQGVYPQTLAPTATSPWVLPGAQPSQLPPGAGANLLAPAPNRPQVNRPNEVIAPLDIYLTEGRTGRAIIGGTVNSDLGVAGKIILEERDFSFSELGLGSGFLRGDGQHLRVEIMPGNELQRYAVSWTQPNLRGYLPYSLSVGGFYYTRELRDWSEQRAGGRVSLGFSDQRGFSLSSELRMEDVKLFQPRIMGIPELDAALGSNDMYRARFRIARDTRDSPFLSSDGGLLELIFDQAFGEHDFSRGLINWSRYWTLYQPLDPTSGARTLSHSWRVGFTGSQTPIFENFYAGGFSTLRGFKFRGASPRVGDVEVGGEFSFLGSLEYGLPITADNMLRGVAFVDYGTVEPEIQLNTEDFRVSLGLGLRLFVPALGPAPFAFDFAYPVTSSPTDERQIFNFFVGATR